MRGATECSFLNRFINSYFNPRAPCGARLLIVDASEVLRNISIHAPHAGRDECEEMFKSLPLISIHAPHAGRDGKYDANGRVVLISIHAPHAGRDDNTGIPICNNRKFQSTRPMRGATIKVDIEINIKAISIHAPHAGRDWASSQGPYIILDFNPRAPCGARQQK